MQYTARIAQRHDGDHHSGARRVADDADAVEVRRSGVGLVNESVGVGEDVDGPRGIDVDGLGIAGRTGADVLRCLAVPLNLLDHV